MNAYKRICKHITERILKMLESGVAPWRVPWKPGNAPRSGSTGKVYRGINLIILASYGYGNPVWFTFNQIRKLGGSVNKGEKSSPIVYWKWYVKKTGVDSDGEDIKRSWGVPFSFNVFNVEQTEGLPEKWTKVVEVEDEDWDITDAVKKADAIWDGYKDAPKVFHDVQAQAYYRPSTDEIHMPPRESFSSAEKYYNTKFHEGGHSTGHKKRIGREGITGMDHFGSMVYSKEELIAEMTACFLSGWAGLPQAELDNHTAYIKGWMSKLKKNEDWILWASSRAQKASDYILGIEDGKMPEA